MEVLYTAAVHGHSAIVDDLLKQMNRSSGYNQDCFNIILRLINHQQEDHALKILKTMKPTQLANGQVWCNKFRSLKNLINNLKSADESDREFFHQTNH